MLRANYGFKADALLHGSHQHLAPRGEVLVNLRFDALINHVLGAAAVRAGNARRGAEKAADQRALGINFTALRAQMRAIQIGECSLVNRRTFYRQARHFFGRSGDRPAAIMAARDALEGRDACAEEADFVRVAVHTQNGLCARPGFLGLPMVAAS